MKGKLSAETHRRGGKLNGVELKDRIWKYTQGTFLEKMFTLKNAAWIFAFVLLFLAQGFNGFTYLRHKREAARLDSEISELRMEQITVETTLMGARRLSAIEERVKNENLDLSIPKNPPVIIEREP